MTHSKLFGLFAAFVLGAVVLSSCQQKQPEPEPETFMSDKERPTWTAPEKYDYTASMTAVIRMDLKAQYPQKAADFVVKDEDVFAAFSGDSCLGVAELKDGLYYLYVVGTEGAVTLRYYSAHYKNIFEAVNAFDFKNDTQLGTPGAPFIPQWVEQK